MSQDKALIPTDQRAIDFYGDELIAVSLDGQPYIPLAPICDFLGVSWSGQSERIRRDAVLSEAALSLRVTRKESQRGGRDMICLPLEYLNGWLFGINASRVREELREGSSDIRGTAIECSLRLSRGRPSHPPALWPTSEIWPWLSQAWLSSRCSWRAG